LPNHSSFRYNKAIGTKEDLAFAAEELGDAKVLLRNLASLHDEQEEDPVFGDSLLPRSVLRRHRYFAFSDRPPLSRFFTRFPLAKHLTHSKQQTICRAGQISKKEPFGTTTGG
jgi:hypothetical protein